MYRTLLVSLLLMLTLVAPAMANTTITYQGRLDLNGEPASGSFDASFRLFTADTTGTQVGATVAQTVPVSRGLFQADLDFGVQAYETPLWLQITVNGVTLTPRQRIAAAPLALRALSSSACPGCNDELAAALNALVARVQLLESSNTALVAQVNALEGALNTANGAIAALQTKTAAFTASGTDLFIDGVNLHVRSGSGSTEGAVNGRGNLIIGYNEPSASGSGSVRTGSHNLVMGRLNSYSSFGGIVSGNNNRINASYASVLSGDTNSANTTASVIVSGLSNTTSATRAVVVGGWRNNAAGLDSVVLGGDSNTTQVSDSTIAGGQSQTSSANARMRAQGTVVP
ncbi:MAG: hypothetical protein MEQ07_11905 [Aquimonas sp.]|nr:hypothetical protein [Aquimonas sp.]